MVTNLPTACAVGYKYFVGYANWLNENPNVYCKVGNESGHTENYSEAAAVFDAD
jgi:hypothetical protein